MVIVKCGEEHISKITAIENESFTDPWSEGAIREAFINPAYDFLVCETPQGVVGYIVGFTVSPDSEIANIAVIGSMRRHGIGKKLIAAYEELCREKYGADTFYLEVRQSNTAARALYETCGFTVTGVRRNYYRKPVENALLMTCRIPENPDTEKAPGKL